MKILITAANGQLGFDVTSFFSKNKENTVIAYNDFDLDITNKEKVFFEIEKALPNVVINCAAYTNVDGAEDNIELAYKVNADAVAYLAEACKRVGATFVHISTDYVFSGESSEPYLETDIPNPINIYGKSKLLGENNIINCCDKYFILRTAWLYGKNGNNFVKAMLKIGAEKGEVEVVTDQTGSPTSTYELVNIINAVLKTDKYGIYNATCEGVASWNDFAKEIFKLSRLNVNVKDTTSEKFIRKAKRPQNSVLSKQKLISQIGYTPKDWKLALKEYINLGEKL